MKGWQGIVTAASILCGLLPTPSARAAIRPHSFSLSPMGGAYFFDQKEDLKTSPAYTLGIGYAFTRNWAGEIVTGYIDSRSDLAERDQVDGYPLRLDVLYHFRPHRRLVPYLAAGFGGLWLNNPSGSTSVDAMVGYGGGVRLFLTEILALRLDLRHIYAFEVENLQSEGQGRHNLAAMAGLSVQIGGDLKPPPQVDSDGDGVIDVFDRCPDTKLGVPVNGFGCPADLDRDGVYDYQDRCPDTPTGIKVNRDGCPPDRDGDGIPDFRDKCSDTPAGSAVDSQGCPATDRDGDGISDAIDRCPETPAGRKVDGTGCPQAEETSLSLYLEFAPGQADILPEFREDLARAAAFLYSHPDRRMIIEGHTDSVGSAEFNLDLSRQRAENVRRYLLDATGISPERIRAQGYGETRPAADNSTQEGRLRNRRVVISVEGGK